MTPHPTSTISVSSGHASKRVAAILVVLVGLLAGLAAVPAQGLVPGTVDKKVWGTDGRVMSIVETPDAVFIGGDFANLVGPDGELVPRTNLAALDPTTGAPLPWTANASGSVWGLALSPDRGTLYLGGQFTGINGIARNRAGAVSTATGAVTSFNPNVVGRVRSVAVVGNTVYAGGDFTSVGGTARARLAALDGTTGALIPSWTATANDRVHTVVASPDGSKVFVGGAFTSIGGSSQSNIAVLSPTTGASVQTLSSRPSDEVIDIEVTGSQVFAAIGGSTNAVSAWSASTGARQWSVEGDGDPQALAMQNGVLYVGGHFTSYDDRTSTGHMVAVNPANGALLDWMAVPNSALGVFALNSFQGHLSVGGDFTKINSLKRLYFARFTEFVDTSAPTVPAKPSATLTDQRSATVAWAASTDNAATSIVYTIYRNGSPVGTVTSSATGTVTFNDTGLSSETSYTYTVSSSDGENVSAQSPASDSITTPVAVGLKLANLEMLDNDIDGRADRVVATFDAPISCTSLCRTPWTLSGVPGGGSLSSVSVSGSTATLTLSEGSVNTAVGSFTVALAASATGIKDAQGNLASFAATAPADKAGPVPTSYTNGPGSKKGVAAAGDTFTVTFSEPLAVGSVLGSGVTARDPLGSGDDTVEIPGLIQGLLDTGSGSVISLDGGVAAWPSSTLSLLAGNTQVRSTIAGTCTGNGCAKTSSPSSHDFDINPATTLTDVAGNAARGSYEADGYVY